MLKNNLVYLLDYISQLKHLVIIPTYNESENISQIIEAVLGLPDMDVLIVDDNSPDGTGDIVEKIKTDKGNDLYEFWGNKVSKEINKAFKPRHPRVLINLASEEYSKVIKRDKLDADELILNFKEWKDDKLRFVSFTAKVARGLMARYIIKNRIRNLEDIKGFDLDGYGFSAEHSDDKTWIFVR